MSAFDVAVEYRWPAVVCAMRVSPMNQREDYGIEGEPLLGKSILMALGPFLIRDAIEHAIRNQTGEAFSQDATGNSEPTLKFLEPSYFQKCLSKNEKCPTIAHDCERAS